MTNKILKGTVIAAFAAILLAWAPSTAYAGNNSANVVHNPDGCGIIDGDGNIIFFEGRSVLVANKNHGMIICQLKDVANSTGQAVHYSGDCTLGDSSTGIFIIGTFKAVVSQNDDGTTGDATLKCRGTVIQI